jgi:RNA polymerase sigma-70 factor, ECF subfamily
MPALLSEIRLKALMDRSLAGDAGAHTELLAELAEPLARYFRRRMSRTEDVEDLVQETLLAIHMKRETYDPSQLVTVWVFAIARYKLIDCYRRSRLTNALSLDSVETLFAAEDDHGANERDVAQLLAGLPVKQADAIRCMRVDGYTAAETALRTGQSVSSVKVGVHRGLRALAARLRRALQ